MYDRRFRQEAAGKDEMKWEKVNMDLLLDLVHDLSQSNVEVKQCPGFNSWRETKRESKRRDGGVCYRFNKGVKCVRRSLSLQPYVLEVWRRASNDPVQE